MGHQEELLKFLKENCDQSLDPEKSTTYFLTGITTQFFKEKLEEQFKIKLVPIKCLIWHMMTDLSSVYAKLRSLIPA